jgi:hypothetical protein
MGERWRSNWTARLVERAASPLNNHCIDFLDFWPATALSLAWALPWVRFDAVVAGSVRFGAAQLV